MDHFDERVKALQKRSLQVLPLKYRRETPQKLLPIEALCEFDTDEVCTVILKDYITQHNTLQILQQHVNMYVKSTSWQ